MSNAHNHTPTGFQNLMSLAFEFIQHELTLCGPAPTARQRQLMIARCEAHLMALTECSSRSALTVAAQAVADTCSRNSAIRIDLGRTTAHALFLSLPDGRFFSLSTADLIDLFAQVCPGVRLTH